MSQEPQHVTFDISWTALFKVVALALGVWAIFFLRDIILLLFAVFILVAALSPTVQILQKHMSRPLAVSLVYAVIALLLVIIGYSFVPVLITQGRDLTQALPSINDKLQPLIHSQQYANFIDQISQSISGGLDQLSKNIFSTGLSVFGGIAAVATGIVISFYLLLEEKNAQDFLHQVLPQSRFGPVYNTISKISERMGSWVRGQVALMVIIGLSNLVVFLVLRVSTPVPLAAWAGFCEILPYVGPFLGVLPALLVALIHGSILQVILVFIFGFVVIQQLEGHIIVPKVMSRAIGLSPVLVIIALLIGVKLFGFIGGIIAIPAAAIISVIVGEWPSLRKMWEEEV